MNKKWGVFEFKTGVLWSVTPPTKKKAKYEADLVKDEGYHLAVPVKWGMRLVNAFEHGRDSNE